MTNLITQNNTEGSTLGSPLSGIGTLGQPGNGVELFTKFISAAIGLMTIIAIIWFIFVLITGAIGMISSGGDKAALENSRKRISNGLIGLVVVIVAIFLVDLIGNLLGIKNILNLPELFTTVTNTLK